MEEDPSERNVARYSRAQDEFASSGGYGAESEARSHRRRARPARRPDGAADRRAVRWRAPASRAVAHPLRRAATRCCSTSRPTTSTSTPRRGCWTSCAPTAGRCSSSATTSNCSTRRSPGCSTSTARRRTRSASSSSTRAPTPSTATPGRATRSASPARRCCRTRRSPGCRASSTASAPRPPRRRWPTARRSRSPGWRPSGCRSGRPIARCGCGSPTRRPPAITVLTTDGLSKAYGGPPVFEDVSFDLGRGERLLVLGLNGAGKTSLLRILAGETRRQPRAVLVRPQRQRRLLRAGARQPDGRRLAARQHPRRRAARRGAHRDAAARPARDDGAVRREGRPATPARCRAGRRPSWRWRC